MAMVNIIGKKNLLKSLNRANEGVRNLLTSQLEKIIGCRKKK